MSLQRAKSCSSVSSSLEIDPACDLSKAEVDTVSDSMHFVLRSSAHLLTLGPDGGGCGFCVVSLKTSYLLLLCRFWLAFTNFSTSDSSCDSSAPMIRERSWWPLKTTKQGTEETSNDSATSGRLSASI